MKTAPDVFDDVQRARIFETLLRRLCSAWRGNPPTGAAVSWWNHEISEVEKALIKYGIVGGRRGIEGKHKKPL